MCAPLVNAAVAIVGLATQRSAARKQEKAAREQQRVRDEEQARQTGSEMDRRQRDAMSERGRLRAASAESGLSGISMTDIVNNVDFGLGMDLATLRQNGASAQRQNAASTDNIIAGIQQPDYIGTVLNAGLQIQQTNAANKPRG